MITGTRRATARRVSDYKRKTYLELVEDLYVAGGISVLELEERVMGLLEAGTADELAPFGMKPLPPPKPSDAARIARPFPTPNTNIKAVTVLK